MRIRQTYVLFAVLFSLMASYSFVSDNPFFSISQKDVELKIPKGFPKPAYTFSNNKLSPEVFILGRKLFYDNLLSKDQSLSCATCHQRIAAFAHVDHRLSHGIYAKIGTRNVPALQNLIWKDTYMWDGGVNNLEVQPINPITNPVEMDESLANVVLKLKQDSNYVTLFKKAFKDTLVNSERLLKALAQFTGLMISSNSRYDKYLNGLDTFSQSEKNGLAVFRLKCASCHKEPLLSDNSYRNNGLKPDTALKDAGRSKITGDEKDRNKFKVPGLRNIAMTYPYMHDGRFRNLKEVLDHYADKKNYDPAVDQILLKQEALSETEKKNLLVFLQTLTDKEFLYDRRFADPGTNQ